MTTVAMPHVVSSSLRKAPGRWGLVVLLVGFTFIGHFNRIAISVAGAEKIISDDGISKQQMGWVYSAYLLVYTLLMIPGGFAIDRWGGKTALAVMAFASAALVLATGQAGLYLAGLALLPALIVIRATLGLVSVPLHPGCAHLIACCVPAGRRTTANGTVTAAALLGIASTYYGFGWLMDRFGWPHAFLICGAVTLCLALAWTVYSVLNDCRDTASQSPTTIEKTLASDTDGRSEWTGLFTNRNLLLLTASYGAIGYFQYMFFYWLEYYFKEVRSLDADTSRWFTTIPVLAMAAGMFAGGWLFDFLQSRLNRRLSRAVVPVCGMAASAVMLLVGLETSEPPWMVLWFSLSMAAAGMSEGPFWVSAVESGGQRGGMAAAIFNTGGNAAGMLGPVLTPALADWMSWKAGFSTSSVFLFLGAAAWLWVDLPSHGQTSAE
jgi:MFS family permease